MLADSVTNMWRTASLRDALRSGGIEPIKDGVLAGLGSGDSSDDRTSRSGAGGDTDADDSSSGTTFAYRAALAFGDLRRKIASSSFGKALNGGMAADNFAEIGSGASKLRLPADAGERWGAEMSDAWARASRATSDISV